MRDNSIFSDKMKRYREGVLQSMSKANSAKQAHDVVVEWFTHICKKTLDHWDKPFGGCWLLYLTEMIDILFYEYYKTLKRLEEPSSLYELLPRSEFVTHSVSLAQGLFREQTDTNPVLAIVNQITSAVLFNFFTSENPQGYLTEAFVKISITYEEMVRWMGRTK